MQGLESVRSRLRFESLDCEATRGGSCDVTVHLEWNGDTYRATEAGLETRQGIIKAATQAALSAALSATLSATLSAASNEVHLQLVGVKAVRAFDGWVVIVRLSGEGPKYQRLLGAVPCETEEELPRTAVQAVLAATNRVLGRGLV
ncbi:MAG: hypothetical protein IIB36_17295 [Gemmatimonadetes bacterium]|nr:hypothetical protein [Gemmatimonadota bacterium]